MSSIAKAAWWSLDTISWVLVSMSAMIMFVLLLFVIHMWSMRLCCPSLLVHVNFWLEGCSSLKVSRKSSVSSVLMSTSLVFHLSLDFLLVFDILSRDGLCT
jgi:hypothetical protein